MSMLRVHVQAAYLCPYPYAMPRCMLHGHVHSAHLAKLHDNVHAACPCPSACPVHVQSMVHVCVHAAFTFTFLRIMTFGNMILSGSFRRFRQTASFRLISFCFVFAKWLFLETLNFAKWAIYFVYVVRNFVSSPFRETKFRWKLYWAYSSSFRKDHVFPLGSNLKLWQSESLI
jgi:hypothetical protein